MSDERKSHDSSEERIQAESIYRPNPMLEEMSIPEYCRALKTIAPDKDTPKDPGEKQHGDGKCDECGAEITTTGVEGANIGFIGELDDGSFAELCEDCAPEK